MSNAPIKLCRDCKHFVADGLTCLKSPKPRDFVDGEFTGYFQAQAERETFEGCGAEGRWWEAK